MLEGVRANECQPFTHILVMYKNTIILGQSYSVSGGHPTLQDPWDRVPDTRRHNSKEGHLPL